MLAELVVGDLVYAANWGGEFERIAFWDTLDYIGVDSYYPLSSNDAPSTEELRNEADAIVERVRRVQAAYGKPVLFTEIGYSGPRPRGRSHGPITGARSPTRSDRRVPSKQ